MPKRRGFSAARLAALGAAAAGVVASTATGGALAHGAAGRALAVSKAPAGRAGELTGVAAAPHSSDLWVLDNAGSQDNANYVIGRRHGGHWQRVKTPKLGGRCGLVNTVAAGSSKAVWLGGARQVSCKTGQLVYTAPAIWRLKGSKFVAAKLPKLDDANSSAVSSISASSATNAWAVGGLYPGSTAAQVAFHWNGKAWSAVAVPAGYAQGLYDVSTSGPTNAWALQSDNSTGLASLDRWDGKTWTVSTTEPSGVSLSAVATSSAKLAYAVGTIYNQSTGKFTSVLLKFNGRAWSRVPVPKSAVHGSLTGVTVHGNSVWVIGSVGGGGRPIVLHSTGHAWKVEKSPGGSYQLASVSAASNSHAFAVGDHHSGASLTTYLAALSGSSWKAEPSKF